MRRRGSLCLMLAGVALLSACSSAEEPAVSHGRPVVVDYSPTVSDVGALLYLLSSPEVDVRAITLPVTGEAGCDLGVDVTLGILAMFERSDIPVACDADRPTDAGDWPQEFVAGNDALALGLPDPVGAVDHRPAHQLIADVVAVSAEPVVLYAVAPLTNVARVVTNHAEIIENLDHIVIMGGAVDAPGNVAGTTAEWNLWIDVPAAAAVMASGAAITLVPLDATNSVPTPGFWLQDLEDAEQSAAVAYLSSMVRVFSSVTSGFFYLWDELAAAVAAGENVATTVDMNIAVVEDSGPHYGSTVPDPEGPLVEVATAVPDPDDFYAHFLTTISGKTVATRSTIHLTEVSAPQSVGPGSSPEEVLAYWLVKSLTGETKKASSVVVTGAPWVGLGESPDTFVEGSEPYGTFDTELACTAVDNHALCDTTWNDLWIDGNPDLDRGRLRARAEVIDGVIVAFEEFAFSPEVVAAFDSHVTWLSAEFPDQFNQACAVDSASRDCSELLVATVSEWAAGR